MWHADTWSPELIDKELGYAEALGFNAMRVYLAYLPWKEDAQGYYNRIDQFLTREAKLLQKKSIRKRQEKMKYCSMWNSIIS